LPHSAAGHKKVGANLSKPFEEMTKTQNCKVNTNKAIYVRPV